MHLKRGIIYLYAHLWMILLVSIVLLSDSYLKSLYQARHLIDNFLAKLKHNRAIAPRYDRRYQNFLGAIWLVIGRN